MRQSLGELLALLVVLGLALTAVLGIARDQMTKLDLLAASRPSRLLGSASGSQSRDSPISRKHPFFFYGPAETVEGLIAESETGPRARDRLHDRIRARRRAGVGTRTVATPFPTPRAAVDGEAPHAHT